MEIIWFFFFLNDLQENYFSNYVTVRKNTDVSKTSNTPHECVVSIHSIATPLEQTTKVSAAKKSHPFERKSMDKPWLATRKCTCYIRKWEPISIRLQENNGQHIDYKPTGQKGHKGNVQWKTFLVPKYLKHSFYPTQGNIPETSQQRKLKPCTFTHKLFKNLDTHATSTLNQRFRN